MNKTLCFLLAIAMLPLSAFAQEKEQDRLKNAGEVLTDILGMPDSIPKYWLDRAEWRQLRTRRHVMPQRRHVYRPMGPSGYDGP